MRGSWSSDEQKLTTSSFSSFRVFPKRRHREHLRQISCLPTHLTHLFRAVLWYLDRESSHFTLPSRHLPARSRRVFESSPSLIRWLTSRSFPPPSTHFKSNIWTLLAVEGVGACLQHQATDVSRWLSFPRRKTILTSTTRRSDSVVLLSVFYLSSSKPTFTKLGICLCLGRFVCSLCIATSSLSRLILVFSSSFPDASNLKLKAQLPFGGIASPPSAPKKTFEGRTRYFGGEAAAKK